MSAEEPSYLAFARANVREGLSSSPAVVRALVERIDRDAAAGPIVIHVAHDTEAHARSFNEGFDAAVAQGLADDPSLAGDWLDEKLAQAFAYGWREGKGIPTPIDVDTREPLHDQAQQPEFNPYRAEAGE